MMLLNLHIYKVCCAFNGEPRQFLVVAHDLTSAEREAFEFWGRHDFLKSRSFRLESVTRLGAVNRLHRASDRGAVGMILRRRRFRSQHKGVLRDFVIEWYADDEGEIFCRTSHVFIRRIAPPARSAEPSAQLDALRSRALSAA
jgi:hypothetical protein